MIRILVTALLALLFPLALSAETIKMLSGEHGDFSRLVLQFPEPIEWEFGRSDNSYELRIEKTDFEFDTREVFSKIPKTRIASIDVLKTGFKIQVANNVHADVFELRAGRLVIDIKDGAPSATSVFEAVMSHTPEIAEKPTPTETAQLDTDLNAEKEPIEDDQIIVFESETQLTSGQEINQDQLGIELDFTPLELPVVFGGNQDEHSTPEMEVDVATSTDPKNLALKDPRVVDLERQLLEQIGRAVSQGLLDADVSQTQQAVKQSQQYGTSEQDVKPNQMLAEDVPPDIDPSPEDRSHIRIQSSIDREQLNLNGETPTDTHGKVCLDNRLVNVADWGRPLEDGLQLQDLRADTIGEFDLPNSTGVKNLARYYIFLTFGAEAKSVLSDFGVTVEGHDVLWALSEIMDKGYAEHPGRLHQQYRCDGPVAFWSVMAKQHMQGWEEYNTDSILSTFSALPIHLRRHLGPSLSERFLAIGDQKSAKYIQSAISRVDGDHGDAFDLLNAEISLSSGELSEAITTYESIVEENGPNAAEALVKVIYAKSANEEGIDRRLAENAEAMAIEFRGNPYERELRNAAILARAYSGDSDLAFKSAYQLSDVESARSDLLSAALIKLAEEKDDATFLKAVLGRSRELGQMDLADRSLLMAANRASKLGFPQDALKLLSGLSDPDTDNAQLLISRAFLEIGEYDAAYRHARKLTGEQARHIEVEALFQLGKLDEAAKVAEGTSMSERADKYALAAGDWGYLQDSNASTLSQFAEIAQQSVELGETNEAGVPSIERAQSILDASKHSRSLLEDMLN